MNMTNGSPFARRLQLVKLKCEIDRISLFRTEESACRIDMIVYVVLLVGT